MMKTSLIATLTMLALAAPAVAQDAAKGEKEFTIKLARSHKELSVPANKSILNVLQESGMNVPSSCEQGVCGTCIVNLLDGQADHRDTFLTDQEHDEGLQIAVCCSRACGTSLTLDL